MLIGIRQALLDGVVSVHEARVAVALTLNPDACTTGARSIEVVSGLSMEALFGRPSRGTSGVIPLEGQRSVLLSCTTRGEYGIDGDHARPMHLGVIRYRRSAAHSACPLISSSTTLGQEVGDPILDVVGGKKDLETHNVRQTAGIAKEQVESLDPALDVWSNTKVHGLQGLGDAGWALALAFGFERTETDLATIERITGLSTRQTRDRIASWEKNGERWVTRTKQGRRTVAVVDFSELIDPYVREVGVYALAHRRDDKTEAHRKERIVVARRKTALGYQAYQMWKTRGSRLRLARHIAETKGDTTLLDLLTYQGSALEAEERIHTYLVAQTQEQEAPEESSSGPLTAVQGNLIEKDQTIPRAAPQTPVQPTMAGSPLEVTKPSTPEEEAALKERVTEMRRRLMGLPA
ncbi:hypothetical protein GQF42_15995 [Streptomyces broussonetiae]|uniref:Uncharacterized protein n=1 Tax=Streptomyces broussonetiae TaxID=2686304 RepID=A0A6I6MZ35_9ACTN|nr:hypothetical protein [Streptomyces broussonetiae]QHA04592.1 hypothetical protein GQF42_15995 [Streptomyces broussonetiae]